MNLKIWAATAAVVLLANACGEEGPQPSGPAAQKTATTKAPSDPRGMADIPPQVPPPKLPTEPLDHMVRIVFVMQVFNLQGQPLPRRKLIMRTTAWAANGLPVVVWDPALGREVPAEFVYPGETGGVPPAWRYTVDMEPGVVAVGITVLYLLGRVGEKVSCHVERDGQRIHDPMTDDIKEVQPLGRSDRLGRAAIVTCAYIGR